MKQEVIVINTDLIEAREISPIALFKSGGTKELVDEIQRITNDFKPDLSSQSKRAEVASIANKVARSKTFLDEIGKTLVSDIKAQSRAIDAERKYMRDRLDEIKKKVRDPLTRWEEQDEARKQKHRDAISNMRELTIFQYGDTSKDVRAAIEKLKAIDIDDSWEEFQGEASEEKEECLKSLEEQLEKAINHEEQQAEIARLRKIEEEHRITQEKQREQEEKAAQEKREKDAADKARREAEEKARVDKENALKQAEEEKEKAVKAERERVEHMRKQEELAAKKREENKRHKAKIHNEIKGAIQEIVNEGLMGDDPIKDIVKAIAKGDVPHLTINY